MTIMRLPLCLYVVFASLAVAAQETPPEPPKPPPTPKTQAEPESTPEAAKPEQAPAAKDEQPAAKGEAKDTGKEKAEAAATQSANSEAEAKEAPATGQVVRREQTGMGTRLQILVYTSDPEGATAAMDEAFAEMHRVAGLMSEWNAESDISKMNANAGGEPVKIAPETLHVLQLGKKIASRSEGSFAMSWAALASLWDFGAEQPKVPPEGQVADKAANLVGDEMVHVNPEAGTAQLEKKGMAIGLGAIAKGYAIDRALEVLEARGFHDALVFAGGDIAVRGSKGDRSWLIGLQDPGGAGYFAVLPLSDRAIATSGDYEQYFEVDGTRYHHILNPKTGMPARGTRSVTIVAPDAARADALATAVFVMGPERGMELVEAEEGVEAVIVTEDNQISISTGLKEPLRVLREPAS